MSDGSIVVVGSGCIGLSIACQLVHAGYRGVSIITSAQTPNTTSDGAGALWRPYNAAPGQDDLLRDWGDATFRYLLSLYRRYPQRLTGITLCHGYETFVNPPTDVHPYWADTVIGFRTVTYSELKSIGLDGIADVDGTSQPPRVRAEDEIAAFAYTSIVIDMTMYLPFITDELIRCGGTIITGKVQSLSPPYVRHDDQQSRRIQRALASASVIVNASGLAARELCNDKHVAPSRGYLVRIRQSALTFFVMSNDVPTYFFPRLNDTVCGGTFDVGVNDTNFSEEIRNDILRRCAVILPDIADYQLVNEWCGLRPTRTAVRCEIEWPNGQQTHSHNPVVEEEYGETSQTALSPFIARRDAVGSCGAITPIVHCYGHGGSGVTLHWGCAADVVHMITHVIQPPCSSWTRGISRTTSVSAERFTTPTTPIRSTL